MRRHAPEILGATFLSSVFSFFSTAFAAKALGLQAMLARALIPRSVTVALALPISAQFDAPLAITAAAVLLQVRGRHAHTVFAHHTCTPVSSTGRIRAGLCTTECACYAVCLHRVLGCIGGVCVRCAGYARCKLWTKPYVCARVQGHNCPRSGGGRHSR